MALTSNVALAALLLSSSVNAFTVSPHRSTNVALNQHIGSGGMADTRNPDAFEDEDPRKSISAAPSFEEYLKQRAGEGTTAAAAPAPAPAAAAAAPSTTASILPSSGVTREADGTTSGMDLTGNTWKPDSEKMGSTDTGDFFPEGYDPKNEVAFEVGMEGSQGFGKGDRGPQLPGMENLGADSVVFGGIEDASDIPEGMEFVMSSVPDGEVEMQVAGTSKGAEVVLSVKPVCMGFEDYYAAFTADSHPSLSVTPCAGRMDRRGGETTDLVISCNPGGKSGVWKGNLVINLPEDNSKICYVVTANVF
eukprot:CAMPEP_0201696034 /NCGR_PEP_ID=MMETSP0578-20130828/7820_1 /ASSEMBLY_ACC=CAM_ASM_000663 /TAXON_ID=267565 /ORGANISM="Skeletonema grethea, Strain CCMP 1804" /LENGTH=305 /DNA_ID=CAMNT_0048181973 /DNA_START=50 /DNA_END=967 /DNA_ORIENTATION=+